MSELRTIASDSKGKKAFDSALQKGAVLAKAVLPAAAKGLAKAYGLDVDGVASAVEGATKAATDIFEKEVDEYAKKKKTIVDFRIKLADFAAKVRGEKPLVFIIDELDRCRPHYAVEVLEQIKHLFTVSGITFVLSIDKDHLAASVRGFYGSEQINTDEYLRRFIDLEYSIPKPAIEQYTKYLFDYYEFDEFFKSSRRLGHGEFEKDRENFLKIAVPLFQGSNSTLRQVEKIFGQTRLILHSFKSNEYTLPEALLVLVFWSIKSPGFYSRLKAGQISLEDFGKEYASTVSRDLHRNWLQLSVEARLLVLIDNEKGSRPGEKGSRHGSLIVEDDKGNISTSLKSDFEEENSNDLARAISVIYSNWDTNEAKLSYLTNKIDLTEPLVFE